MSFFFKTSLEGKINNLPQFKNEALLPVFEAVANSIQAIEEKGDVASETICVTIIREKQLSFKGLEPENSKIIGFEISDTGIGFNDINYDSFLTAETTHKIEKGCKGIGRFFWLKAFDRVEVESVYLVNDEKRLRSFRFTRTEGITDLRDEKTDLLQKTTVKLIGFKESYRDQPSAYKTKVKIAQRILEHCLSYFINHNVPKIIIYDGDESISLSEEFIPIEKHITKETINIKGESFKISHIKLYSTHTKMHTLVLCAHSRGVKNYSITHILGTSQHFDENNEKFIYAAYVTSSYLDKHVGSSRMEFDIPEKDTDFLCINSSLSLEKIKTEITLSSKKYLQEYLLIVNELKRELASNYVTQKNPTLRAVLHYCPEIYDEIEPNTSEEKIDEILYKYKGKAEYQIRKQSEKLLKTQAESVEEIKNEYSEINEKIESFQKDQLSGYVLYRKMIIELLDKKISLNSKGKYHNEDIIHDIVFPRKSTTHQIDFEDHNMWLIDERLAFHAYAASDCRLSDTTSSESTDRPDIITFSEVGEDRVARAVSIIEFKKPQRTDFDEDPTRQLYRYVRKVKDGHVKFPNGRDLIVNDTTRFYCYAICDLTSKVVEYAENNNYAQLQGEFGYYQFNRILNAHTEIVAFDKIILDAKQRHKIFFQKLGI
jgi:hypothetical protein